MKVSLDHIVNKLFNWLVIVVVLFSIVSLSFLLMNTSGFISASSKIKFINDVPEVALGGVQGENILIQTFKAKTEIQAIGVKMATFDRENPGEVTIQIKENTSGTLIFQNSIPAIQIRDNGFNEFRLNSPLPGDGKEYAIYISGSTPDILQSVGVWCSYTDIYPDGHLTVSEVESEGDMLFYLIGTTKNNTIRPIIKSIGIAAIILALIIVSMLYFHHQNKVTAQS